ncbi:hypothetical protein Btru_050113 [Bulinus truncatus]|nr:hypothetical protein Btru_050113 [Bulinus truncatus]
MNTTTLYTDQTSEKEEDETFQSENRSAIIGLAFCFALVTLFTILSNSLVMSAIIKLVVKDFQLGLQNQPLKGGNSMITKFLILSMAFCGMVYDCFEMPLSMIKFAFHDQATIDGCSRKPQRFHSWAYSTIFPLVFGFLFLVLLLSIWIIYFQVLRMVLSFRKRLFYRRPSYLTIKTHKLRTNTSNGNSAAIVTSSANSEDRWVQNNAMSKRKFQNNVKCFRFVGLVLTSITAGRLPVWMVYILQYMTGLTISEWVNQFLGWLAFCTYSVNPILYCSNKTISQAVKDIARKILKI